MYEVAGKTAVVTGAASGIGLGMARAFAGAGMSVVLADVEAEPLDAAVAELVGNGHPAIGVITDVSEESQVVALADAAVARFGAVHVAVQNAGVGLSGLIDDMSIEDWRWTLDVNLWGVIHGIRTFMPLLKAQGEGHMMATASVAGLTGAPTLAAYSASKHAVVGLMDSLRLELAGSGVRASVLCPGPVATNVAQAVRNRPGDRGFDAMTDQERDLTASLAADLAQGLDPDDVGQIALDAIRNEQFWILTHAAEHFPVLDRRVNEIRTTNSA